MPEFRTDPAALLGTLWFFASWAILLLWPEPKP